MTSKHDQEMSQSISCKCAKGLKSYVPDKDMGGITDTWIQSQSIPHLPMGGKSQNQDKIRALTRENPSSVYANNV